jgi:hypothetical protein
MVGRRLTGPRREILRREYHPLGLRTMKASRHGDDAAGSIDVFEHCARGEWFSGACLRRQSGSHASCASENPILDLSQMLLAPGLGFSEALSRIYQTDLEVHAAQLALVQGLRVSGAFLRDPAYRAGALEDLCEHLAGSPMLLLSYPPSALWRAVDGAAEFRLHRSNPILRRCASSGSASGACSCSIRRAQRNSPSSCPLTANFRAVSLMAEATGCPRPVVMSARLDPSEPGSRGTAPYASPCARRCR